MRNVLSDADSSQEDRECIHRSGNDCPEDKQLQREKTFVTLLESNHLRHSPTYVWVYICIILADLP